jgi:hypothetical protein
VRTVVASLALLALLIGAGSWLFPTYPDPAVAEALIERWPDWSPAQRAKSLRALLARLARADSAADDRAMRQVLLRLGDLYERTGDTAVLDALDATRIGGGFANEVCALYRRLARQGAARAHLVAGGAAGVRRCEGISWSPEELEALLRH